MSGALLAVAVTLMQPWGELNIGDRIVIMGLPTFGKSTLCERLAADAWCALFFSPVRDFERAGRLVATLDELERYPDLLRDPHSRIAVRVDSRGRELAQDAARCIALAEAAGRDFDETRQGGRVFLMDEVGDYRRYLEDGLNSVFRRGRHYGLVPIFASQVATDIPLRARKLASRVLCLGQRHEDEVRELTLYGKDFARRVAAWRKYEPPIEWLAETAKVGGVKCQ